MRLFLIVASLLCALAEAEPGFNGLQHSSYRGGKRFDFALTCKQVAAAPEWKLDEPNPPLSARDALAIARRELEKIVPSPEVWRVQSIGLNTACTEGGWYYAIELAPPEEGINRGMTIPVLMDGTTADPTISAWPESR